MTHATMKNENATMSFIVKDKKLLMFMVKMLNT